MRTQLRRELRSLFRAESYRRGFAWSVATNILAKSLAFLVLLAVSYYFTLGGATDVYFFLTVLVSVVSTFITSLNGTVVIPRTMLLLAQEGVVEANRFSSSFLLGYAVLATLVAAPLLIWPVRVCGMLTQFAPSLLVQSKPLIRSAAILLVLTTVSMALSDLLFSQNFFTLPTLMSASNSVLSLLALLTFHSRLGLSSVLAAMNAGYVLQIVLMAILLRRTLNWSPVPMRVPRDRTLWRDVAAAYFGNITSAVNGYVPAFLLSGFGPGTLTALAFAQSAVSAPASLLTTQAAGVAGIQLNALAARRDFAGVNCAFVRAANLLHLLTVPIGLLLCLFSDTVISALFGHRADSAGVLKTASLFLRFLGVQVFLTPINVLSSRLLSACQKVRNAVAYQICFSVVLFGMLITFVHLFGAAGYAVALAAMYGANVLMLYWLLKVSTPFVDYGAVLLGLGAIAGASVICLAVAYAVFGLFSRQPTVFPLGVGGMFACFMLLASRYLADVIDIRELRGLWPRSRVESA